MVFSSLLFLFRFLPIVLALYFIAPKKIRNLILFLASLVFYAWGEPVYVTIMLFSTVVDYVHGMLTDYFLRQGKIKKARLMVASSVTINLLLLCTFKYADFIISNINGLLGTNITLLQLSLPIGISFYTFQTMSYTIDVYRGEAPVQKNIISFGAYVALFPQLIAGPIVQYKTIAAQLNDRRENFDDFASGVKRFVAGMAKKVLLANNIGLLWEQMSSRNFDELTVLSAWLGALAFTFQIYFDFSGYSDMAIGLGRMFGFKFNENFNYPYESRSITEFWRRWHISLGTWFKEYVYIPLGGNRTGKFKQVRNIFIVWALTGIWHGASWNFLVWGLYYGVILMIEKMFLLKVLERLPSVMRRIYTLVIVVFGWVIFAFDSIGSGVSYMKAMINGYGSGLYDTDSLYLVTTYAILLIILVICSTHLVKKCYCRMMDIFGSREILKTVVTNAAILVLLVVSVAYLVDASYNPFLYFRF